MKKKAPFRLLAALLCLPLLFTSCEINSIFGKTDGTITGIIDPGNASLGSTLLVQTIDYRGYTDGLTFSATVLQNSKPQFVVITDEDDNLLMMYRGVLRDNDNITINARSTAEALVTFHPLFGPVIGEEYSQLVNIITATSYFDSLQHAVEHAIAQHRNLTDTTNSELILALHNVMRQVSETAFANLEKIDSKDVNDEINCYPLRASSHDSILELRAPATCPSYYGTLYRMQDDSTRVEVKNVYVPARDGYCGMVLFPNNATAVYGNTIRVAMPMEGKYMFELSRRTSRASTDFYLQLASNVMGVLGVNLRSELVYALAIALEGVIDVQDYRVLDFADVMDLVASTYSATNEFISQQPTGLEVWNNWAVTDIMLIELTDLYKTVREATNAIMRVTWQLSGLNQDIDFVVNYDGTSGIRPQDKISIQIVGGNNQTAAANTTLPQPLSVKVTIRNNAGEIMNTPQLVGFLVVTGDGTLSNVLVPTNQEGIAQTSYTMGSTESGAVQHIAAAVVDMTGNILSDTVFFKVLTSNERWHTRLKCTAQNSYVLITDVELQLGSSETGAVAIVPNTSYGYDYDNTSLRAVTTGTFDASTRQASLVMRTYAMNGNNGEELTRTDYFHCTLNTDQVGSFTTDSTLFAPGWEGCPVEIDMARIGATSSTGLEQIRPRTQEELSKVRKDVKFVQRIQK